MVVALVVFDAAVPAASGSTGRPPRPGIGLVTIETLGELATGPAAPLS